MKVLLVISALLAVALAQTNTTKAPLAVGAVCTKTSECGEGACCVTNLFGKKKRFLFNSVGHCQVERQENESCHVFLTHDILHPQMYDDYCPCRTGLECRGKTVDETGGTIVHHNPMCQPRTSGGNN